MVNAGLFSLALAGFAALAAAQPHRNQHRHVARDNIITKTTTLYVTVTGTPPDASDAPIPASVSATVVLTTQTNISTIVSAVASSSTPIASPIASSSASSSASAPATSPSTESSDDSVGILNYAMDLITGAGVDTNPYTNRDFPDGKLDCSHFPAEYGAIPVSWVTKQGWSGIQINGGNGDAVGYCLETGHCSYACPAGFSKSQWPNEQPASGESMGGLLCKGGKLHLTRPSYTKLCQAGAGGVTVTNKLKQMVAVCRTDYPGKAQFVIPVLVATF